MNPRNTQQQGSLPRKQTTNDQRRVTPQQRDREDTTRNQNQVIHMIIDSHYRPVRFSFIYFIFLFDFFKFIYLLFFIFLLLYFLIFRLMYKIINFKWEWKSLAIFYRDNIIIYENFLVKRPRIGCAISLSCYNIPERARDSYHDFLDTSIGLLLTRKPLNQGCLLVMTWLTVMAYVSHKSPRRCSTCR